MRAEDQDRTINRIGLSAFHWRATQLEAMTIPQLWGEYERVFDETTSSRNKRYLVRRIAYRLQEKEYGGLSQLAHERMEELARNAPIRRSMLGILHTETENKSKPAAPQAEAPTSPIEAPPARSRDPRLPAVGTVIRKRFHEADYQVTILENGFELAGKTYASLSGVAVAIAGTTWNGFLFFSNELKAAKGEES